MDGQPFDLDEVHSWLDPDLNHFDHRQWDPSVLAAPGPSSASAHDTPDPSGPSVHDHATMAEQPDHSTSANAAPDSANAPVDTDPPDIPRSSTPHDESEILPSDFILSPEAPNNDLEMVFDVQDDLGYTSKVYTTVPDSNNPGEQHPHNPPLRTLEAARLHRFGPFAHDIRCPQHQRGLFPSRDVLFTNGSQQARVERMLKRPAEQDVAPTIWKRAKIPEDIGFGAQTGLKQHALLQIVDNRQSNVHQPASWQQNGDPTAYTPAQGMNNIYSPMGYTTPPVATPAESSNAARKGKQIPEELLREAHAIKLRAPRDTGFPPQRQVLKEERFRTHFTSSGVMKKDSDFHEHYGDERLFPADWWHFLVERQARRPRVDVLQPR